jgi:hypothetical protein
MAGHRRILCIGHAIDRIQISGTLSTGRANLLCELDSAIKSGTGGGGAQWLASSLEQTRENGNPQPDARTLT